MGMSFFTNKGEVVQCERELGKGGEGSVYERFGNSNQVIKLYNSQHIPDNQKQSKLCFMVNSCERSLLDYAAWPIEALRKNQTGPVVGFLMPKVVGFEPIHALYSPVQRRQNHPELAWDFLLHVARNIAAAFATIHQHGHVIGDVNQDNVLVGRDSKVMLIDCDSFQVNANGVVHFCEVGVSFFTPPELQGVSFKGLKRTPNHDNFGLALFIFHLLFGGRHPFSGKPLQRDAGDSLENDIKAFRFAYGKDSRQRGFEPPPNSIPFSLVPSTTQSLFEDAFTERGVLVARPSAQQWLAELDNLRWRLKHCPTVKTHVYPNHLAVCPWCSLESQGIFYFLDSDLNLTRKTSSFVLTRAWAVIDSIQIPEGITTIPIIASIVVVPTPLPKNMRGGAFKYITRISLILVGLIIAAFISEVWWLFVPFILFMWPITNDEKSVEYVKRNNSLIEAQRELLLLKKKAHDETSPEKFKLKKQELTRLFNEYQSLTLQEKNELDRLQKNASFHQKQRFLERFLIESASIPGVGAAKKAALRSFGIETAADVTQAKVQAVRGFGDVLTNAVVDWRKSCERRFVFNPNAAISEADKNAVRAKIAIRRRFLEASLNAGPEDLERLRQEVAIKVNTLYPQLEAAAKKLAQAQADLKIAS